MRKEKRIWNFEGKLVVRPFLSKEILVIKQSSDPHCHERVYQFFINPWPIFPFSCWTFCFDTFSFSMNDWWINTWLTKNYFEFCLQGSSILDVPQNFFRNNNRCQAFQDPLSLGTLDLLNEIDGIRKYLKIPTFLIHRD